MPWITRSRMDALQARISGLVEQVADARAAELEQAKANGRLARRATTAEDCMAGARAALVAAHRELKAENERLRAENDQLRRANRGLRPQLDNALGCGAEELTAIEAGKTKPKEPVA
jgi:hypothetical protein